MEPVIDIVGHFGTTLSYATVGSRVALALRETGHLGQIMNLDPGWHPSHVVLRSAEMKKQGTHVLLFTPPNHYIDVFAEQYGRERSAIFMSPNTDTLADEHAMTCAKFGLAIVPSEWCERVVRECVPDIDVALLPLGVDAEYATGRKARRNSLRARAAAGASCRVLHLSTDQSWPGRKGTEELLVAWGILVHGPSYFMPEGRLCLHLPPSLHRDAMYLIRKLEVDDSVSLVLGGERGTDDLLSLFDNADLLVAPSRCEGFGMMFLSAIVAGLPMLCTYNTGHRDFLADSPGWIGVPTPDVGSIAREEGLAPVVEPKVLAHALLVAMQPDARMAMMAPSELWGGGEDDEWGTWESALPRWRQRITDWMEETCRTE